MIDVVVFFLLGVLARLVKSDLRLPEALYETLSIYLLLAIGLKGGIELSRQPVATLAPQVLACMALGFVIPFALYPLARALRLGGTDAAALAAHYGSVGKSVLLLMGGLAIGAVAGVDGTAPIKAVFIDPFKGVLALFLLELGLVAGGVALLATLAASASYIAAPTAMRIAVPQANAALSITAALGITFPFNIVLGIPLYIVLAQRITT